MKVPMLDIASSDQACQAEISAVLQELMKKGHFIGGFEVQSFEKEFASYCGVSYAVATNSGTSALHLILRAYGIGSGDEVITVPNTFIATVEAIVHAGATPRLVDIDPKTFTLDPEQVEKVIGPKTKAIVPVHLYGCPAPMKPLLETAARKKLKVIEDACQAHGAKYFGRKTGSLADAAAFSFYPSKNLGAYGDAGAMVTNDEDLFHKVNSLHDHGRGKVKNDHVDVGYTERMDSIQAAVLRIKLRHLERFNEKRREVAKFYTESFADLPITPQHIPSDHEAVFHLYVLRLERRDELFQYLQNHNIACDVHYPTPIHLQPAFRFLGLASHEFPNAIQAAQQILSLPLFPGMTDTQVEQVSSTVRNFFKGK